MSKAKDYQSILTQLGLGKATEHMSEDELVILLEQLGLVDKTPVESLKIPLFESFDAKGIAKYIKDGKAKKIMIMSGAGISVAAGIPDFRQIIIY